MAMKGPGPRIVGIEGNHHAAVRGHQYRIADRTREPHPIDLDDLELVSVQMHRMRHRYPVDYDQLNPFALGQRERWNILIPGDVVNRPNVTRHLAGQVQPVYAVRLALFQWLPGA